MLPNEGNVFSDVCESVGFWLEGGEVRSKIGETFESLDTGSKVNWEIRFSQVEEGCEALFSVAS